MLQCSRSCDTGLRTREVKCLDANEDLSQSCAAEEKPELKQTCNTNPCLSRSLRTDAQSLGEYQLCCECGSVSALLFEWSLIPALLDARLHSPNKATSLHSPIKIWHQHCWAVWSRTSFVGRIWSGTSFFGCVWTDARTICGCQAKQEDCQLWLYHQWQHFWKICWFV